MDTDISASLQPSGVYNFTNTNHAGAYLGGASLAQAILNDANFKGASFTGANLSGAICPDGSSATSNGGACVGHL